MPPRSLLLTLDAFGTLFHPRHPVPNQYLSIAHAHGFPPSLLSPAGLQAAFKTVFKDQARARPNYGRKDVLRGQYGGPRQWWEDVIRGSFSKAIANNDVRATADPSDLDAWRDKDGQIRLPDALIQELIDCFAGSTGYALYEDAGVFFASLRRVRAQYRQAQAQARQENGNKNAVKVIGPFENVVIAVLSNSDDRVPLVLDSLGVKVGPHRADQDLTSRELPGFEQRDGTGTGTGTGRESQSHTDDDVDLVVTSYEAGEEKPHALIFRVAERQARKVVADRANGLKESEWTCVHVGDDLEKDYRAAVDAGWDALYLPREGEEIPDGVRTVRSLVDVIARLEGY